MVKRNTTSRDAKVLLAHTHLRSAYELIDEASDTAGYDWAEDDLIDLGVVLGEINSADEKALKVFGVSKS